jgi:outer membrane protein OmpA-like peptidoglycan-associated protein
MMAGLLYRHAVNLITKTKSTIMANLDVQPKKRTSFLPWLLLGLGLVALIFFLTRNRNGETKDVVSADTTKYTNTSTNAAAADLGWNELDWNIPTAHYPEVTNKAIEVRSNDRYAIYGLGENVLFDSDQATLKSGAEKDLKEIAASINQRYKDGEVRVYGYADSKGDATHNQSLSEQRANAVRDWLSQHGIDNNRISVAGKGENEPAASNSSEKGRQQNRRVEIVARQSSRP